MVSPNQRTCPDPLYVPEQAIVIPVYNKAQARDWLTRAQNRTSRQQCWQCGRDLADQKAAGYNTDQWTVHPRPWGGISCCITTAERFKAIFLAHRAYL